MSLQCRRHVALALDRHPGEVTLGFDFSAASNQIGIADDQMDAAVGDVDLDGAASSEARPGRSIGPKCHARR